MRRQFVRTLLARRTAPKGALRFAVGNVLAEPENVGRGPESLVGDLLGVEPDRRAVGRHVGADVLADAPDARLALILVARVADAVEAQIGVHTWRHPDRRAGRYLAWLAETGYTLSDIETRVVDQAVNRAAGGGR